MTHHNVYQTIKTNTQHEYSQISSHPSLSSSSFLWHFLVSFVDSEVPQSSPTYLHRKTFEHVIKQKSNLQIRETNDPVAKCFKMSLHVYLERLGVTSAMAGDEGWKCLISDSWRHVKLLGMRLSRFLLHPISLKSFRVHSGKWLIQKEQQDT